MTSTDGDVLLLFRCEELHLTRGKQKRKQKLQVCLKWFNEEDITVSGKWVWKSCKRLLPST